MKWIAKIDGGPRRVNHAADIVGDYIYSFGGYCSGENYRELRKIDVHVLNTVTLRWRALGTNPKQDKGAVPFQRYGHTVNSYGPLVYLWGGRNDSMASNTLHCYDTRTNLWTTPKVGGEIPDRRDGHSSCIVNNSLYVFAGFLEDTGMYTEDVNALNLETFIWTYVTTRGLPPLYRDFHTATAVGNFMYVFGGRIAENGYYDNHNELYNRDIFSLDTLTNEWRQLHARGDIPIGRRSHSAFFYNGKIYIFGGYNKCERVHYNSLYEFDTVKEQWTRINPLGTPPCCRRRQAVCINGTKVYLFGGTSPISSCDSNNDLNTGSNNLMDLSDLHILDFEPSLVTLCMVRVIQLNLKTSCLPQNLQLSIKAMVIPNTITARSNSG